MKNFKTYLEEKRFLDPGEALMKQALQAMDKEAKGNKKQSLTGIAFDILRQFKLDMKPRELAIKYQSVYESTIPLDEEAPANNTQSGPGMGDDNTLHKKMKKARDWKSIYRRHAIPSQYMKAK